MCRSCGAIVGAGESVCSACGEAVSSASAASDAARPYDGTGGVGRGREVYDNETVRFARAVLARPVTFTFVFLVANVFVFLLMHLAGGTENHEVLRSYGAKYNSLINSGEWWRLVTPVFIHIGWMHLFVNMYSLFMLGPYVERLYGSSRFVFFWVVTGVAGVAASYLASSVGGQPGVVGRFLFRGGDGPSAGASGALFGLVGVLFVFGLRYRKELPEGFKRAFGVGMLPTLLINLVIGYTIPFIDNAAHVGGFLAGALLALVVGYKRPGQTASVAAAWRVAQIVSLVLVAASFGEVARHFDGPAPTLDASRRAPSREEELAAAAGGFVGAYNAGQTAFRRALDNADADAADAAIARIESAPRLDDKSHQLLEDLKALVARARDEARRPEAERRDAEARARREKLVTDFEEWAKRADDWARNEGSQFVSIEPVPEGAPPGTEGEAAPAPGGAQSPAPGGAQSPAPGGQTPPGQSK